MECSILDAISHLNKLGLEYICFDNKSIDDKEYNYYECRPQGECRPQDNKLEGVSPLPYRDLTGVIPPLGQEAPRHDIKEFFAKRVASYVPFYSIFVGVSNLGSAAYAIYRYVILNNGSLYQYSCSKDDEAKVYVLIQREHEVVLDSCQRLAVLGLSIALMVRGIFSILCVGIILLPLDYLYDRLSQPRNEPVGVENKIAFDFSMLSGDL